MYIAGTVARLKGVVLGVLLRGALMMLIPFMSVGAGSVNLVWNASPDAEVAGYNVYYGTASQSYSSMIPVGTNVASTISGLAGGSTYYFAVTAVDATGIESDFSNETSSSVPGGNQAPTISTIANQTGNVNQTTAAIAFTIGDAQTSPGNLILSAISFNATLVPNGNIVFGGSGANRTVKITPAANQTGTAQITIFVSDGVNTTSTSFILTVQTPVNTPPTISTIANQTANMNQATAAIAFTIGDAETSAASLTLSGTSLNTTLVPNASIAFAGSGASRTVKITPAANQTGSAQITVSVSDGVNTTTTSFTLTVQAPVNTPPTISTIANQTGNENQATAAIPFTIGDAETSAASLTVSATSLNTTLVPNANFVFGGSGASRNVKITPAADQTGSAQITISVSDGVNTTSTSFTLTVQQAAANTPPTISAIPDQSGYSDSPTAAIPFAVDDAETAAASLTLSATSSDTTLVPTANIVFGGSAQNRTVTITPGAGQIGTAQITIIVSDGSATAQTTFNLNIQQATTLARSSLPKSSTYNGLFYEEDAVRVGSAGAFKLTVTSLGKYSGSVQMADGLHAFTGQFGTFCQGSNVILRKLGSPLVINFSLLGDNSTNSFSGNLSDGVWASHMHGARAVFNLKTNPAPYAGTYTIAIPNPDDSPTFSLGNGFGSVKVDGNGNVKLAGVLADGTKISQSAPLSKDGTWPLFAPLYSGKGLVIAWISFTNRAADDLHGQINWVKGPDAAAKYYPEGLAIAGDAVGSIFAPPSILALNLQVAKLQSAGTGNGRITSLTVSSTTGTFKGSLLQPTGASVTFQGALLQRPNAGYGFILGTNDSMPVLLSP